MYVVCINLYYKEYVDSRAYYDKANILVYAGLRVLSVQLLAIRTLIC